MFYLDIKSFLNKVCEEIKYKPARKGISEELELHIQEIKEDFINKGINSDEAEEKAVSQMRNCFCDAYSIPRLPIFLDSILL